MWFFDVDWSGDTPLSKTLALRLDESTCFKEPEVSLEKEYRVYRALEGTPVPVIANYWYESDPTWFGQPFVVRERMTGVQAGVNHATQEEKQAVLEGLIETLAAQHQLDWHALGLEWLGVPESAETCASDLLETWIAVFRRDQVVPDPLLAAAARQLRSLPKPVASRIVLVQGQVGPNQVLWRDGKVVASLDWESCFLGDPVSDLAYLSMTAAPHVDRAFLSHLYQRYSTLTGLPVPAESLAYYQRFQSFWCGVVARTAFGRYVSGDLPNLETLRLATVLSRPFVRRLESLVCSP
jgi:aminoglycoside phosphotransferase (APT) family kinase protein